MSKWNKRHVYLWILCFIKLILLFCLLIDIYGSIDYNDIVSFGNIRSYPRKRCKWFTETNLSFGKADHSSMMLLFADGTDSAKLFYHHVTFLFKIWLYTFILLSYPTLRVSGNRPPQFVIGSQPEIILRLKEGPDTPVGKNLYM